MKKLILTTLFLLITPFTLVISFFTLNEISPPRKISILAQAPAEKPIPEQLAQPSRLYAALPQAIGEVAGVFTTGDARPIIIEKYLEKHDSPLLPYADELLQAAERYDVDYRLIVAIAQCESNLCKKSPQDSYNCWGFENGATRFLSWEQALDQVAKTLREEYLNKGLTTPEEIMPKYAPPSVEKGGPWAKCVQQFTEELEYGRVD